MEKSPEREIIRKRIRSGMIVDNSAVHIEEDVETQLILLFNRTFSLMAVYERAAGIIAGVKRVPRV